MKNDINLLHTKTKSPLGSLASKVNILRTIAVFLLFLVSILSVAFFFLILVSPLPTLRREENARRLVLRSLYGKLTNVYIINERTNAVQGIFDKQVHIDTIVSLLVDSLPTNVSADTITANNKEVLLQASSTSLQALQAYLDAIISSNKEKKIFSDISQSDLTISPETGQIQVRVALAY